MVDNHCERGAMTEARPDPSAELARRAEEASVAYEHNMAFRTFVLMIPVIGSSLDLVLTSGGQRSRERIHKLIDAMKDDMQERLETVEDSAVDEEYLKSEEFFDLIMKALDTTIKTRDEAKRRTCARILIESTIFSKREGYSPEEYLDLIADLTPRELAVAQALYRDLSGEGDESRELKESREAWMSWQDRVRAKVGIDGADLQLILDRLHSSGLITEDTALVPSSGGPIQAPPQYWMSPAFKKLMRFLERRGQTLED